ncbi:MAG TPA: GTPase HflX, partial [Methyloceanibacter sp.]
MRPTDPKELKRKKQPAGRGQRPARREGRVKAVVLAPVLGKARGKGGSIAKSRDASERSPQARLDEAVGLAAAIDLDVKASGLVP